MNDQPINSAINPAVRADLKILMRQATEERAGRRAKVSDRRLEENERQASYYAAMPQTLAAFRQG